MERDSSTFIAKTKPWISLVLIIAIAIGLSVILICPGILGRSAATIWGVELSLFVCLCFPLLLLIISICYLIREFRRINRHHTGKWGLGSILNTPKSLYLKFMVSVMGICFSAGWALNILALWQGENGNIAKVLVHGAIAAFELFFLDINEDIFQEMEQHGKLLTEHGRHLVEGGIIMVSVLSTICMFSLLVNLFLTRMSAWIHNCFVKVKSKKNNQLYIFFGVGKKEIALAQNIKEAYEDKHDPNDLIIYVDTRNDDEEKHNNWESIVSFLTVNNHIVPLINQDKHSMYLVSEAGFDKAVPNNFWRSMGLSKIQKRIRKLAKISRKNSAVHPELHFFFLSDDRNQNIDDTRILSEYLSQDKEIAEIPKVIYCQTRKSSVTSVIEDSRSNHDVNLEVRVVDESVLAIEQLKGHEDFHPARYVEFEVENADRAGFAKTPFSSLIVGFGETGRDALRFLYEYGAFIDAKKEGYARSQFSCHVIDTKGDPRFNHFIATNPAIKEVTSVNSKDDTKLINFFQVSDKSSDFYSLLADIASGLNYVVISTGDEEQNITIAVNILKYVRTKRVNLRNFVILVRVYENNSYSHINKIATHYNKILKSESAGADVIHIFGHTEEIFRYDTIVKSDYKKEGIDYYDSYSKAYHKTEEGSKYPIQSWQERRRSALRENNLANIEDLHRKESQDYSNAWHALTKGMIMEQVLSHTYDNTLENNTLKALAEHMFRNENDIPVRDWHTNCISYPVLDKLFGTNDGISTLITNMAITEHARWIAAHEMLGYSYRTDICYFHNGDKKSLHKRDDIRKHHPCMVKWAELPLLPARYERLYDYLVVETTLHLMLDKDKRSSL